MKRSIIRPAPAYFHLRYRVEVIHVQTEVKLASALMDSPIISRMHIVPAQACLVCLLFQSSLVPQNSPSRQVRTTDSRFDVQDTEACPRCRTKPPRFENCCCFRRFFASRAVKILLLANSICKTDFVASSLCSSNSSICLKTPGKCSILRIVGLVKSSPTCFMAVIHCLCLLKSIMMELYKLSRYSWRPSSSSREPEVARKGWYMHTS